MTSTPRGAPSPDPAPPGPLKLRWTLLVRGHGRWKYLTRALQSLAPYRRLFDRTVYSFDGVDVEHQFFGDMFDPRATILSTGPERKGLAANLGQAWGALTDEDEWVLDWEEDFVALDLPLEQMAATLEANRDLAQMALVRQPWSPEEHAAGGLLYGPNLQGEVVDEGGWLRQKRIFTLNPYVSHASLLRSLQPAVETSLTEQCRERGLSFGYWGAESDAPRVLHIGAEGGMGSAGWLV